MAEFTECSLHLFDNPDFQMESSARFPKIDATDLLEMREDRIRTRILKEAEKPGSNGV